MSSRLPAESHVKVNTDGRRADDRQEVKQNDETTRFRNVWRGENFFFTKCYIQSAAENMHSVSLLWHKCIVQEEHSI